MTNIITM
jgi:hypothetical protein